METGALSVEEMSAARGSGLRSVIVKCVRVQWHRAAREGGLFVRVMVTGLRCAVSGYEMKR